MTTAAYILDRIQMRYADRLVLDIPSLQIKEGETLAVVGPSGSGKSTLLRLLDYLEPPSQGQIKFFGTAPEPARQVAVRRRIGVLFQRPEMLAGSLRQNIRFGQSVRGAVDEQRIGQVLAQVHLDSLAEAAASTLSGGEIQRAALARVLVYEPEVLLLDEPTANLDPANVKMFETIFQEAVRDSGVTAVLVTHNVHQARRLADRIAFLLNGELIELSPTGTFFSDPLDPRSRAFVEGEMIY
jgi:tungstate transport system ATP-binding protein